MGSGAKSYMKKSLLIQYIRKCANFSPYMRRPKSYMTLHPIPLNFLIYEEIFFSFLSVYTEFERRN